MKQHDGRTATEYIRVNAEGQAAEGVSLAARNVRIEAWAVANGMQLAAVDVHATLQEAA